MKLYFRTRGRSARRSGTLQRPAHHRGSVLEFEPRDPTPTWMAWHSRHDEPANTEVHSLRPAPTPRGALQLASNRSPASSRSFRRRALCSCGGPRRRTRCTPCLPSRLSTPPTPNVLRRTESYSAVSVALQSPNNFGPNETDSLRPCLECTRIERNARRFVV